MKTQKITFSLLVLLVTLSQMLLVSCSSNKVVSSSFIQKRKYTGGYHFSHASRKAVNKEVQEAASELTESNLTFNQSVLVDEQPVVAQINVTSYKVEPVLFNTKPAILEFSPKQTASEFSSGKQATKSEKIYAARLAELPVGDNHEQGTRKLNGTARAFLILGILALLVVLPGLGLTFAIMFGIASLFASGKKEADINQPERNKGEGWKILGTVLLALVLITIFFVLLALLISTALGGFSFAMGC